MNSRLISPAELRNFGLIMAIAVTAFFGILLPLLKGWRIPAWPWILSLFFLLSGYLRPQLLRLPYITWMFMGEIVGTINRNILLFVIFYFIFCPLGLVLKWIGRDSLNRKLDRDIQSYRVIDTGYSFDMKDAF